MPRQELVGFIWPKIKKLFIISEELQTLLKIRRKENGTTKPAKTENENQLNQQCKNPSKKLFCCSL